MLLGKLRDVMGLRISGLLALLALSACTVEGGYASPSRPPPPRPGPMCTLEYAPVCGQRGNQTRTFSNSCQARSNGFSIIHRGECSFRPAPPRPPSRPPVQACTREFAPVCAERRGQRRTFSNSCEARASGFSIIRSGECSGRPPVSPPISPPMSPPGRPLPGTQACTREYAPVCAQRGSSRRTFSNSCLAGADGFHIIHRGQCR